METRTTTIGSVVAGDTYLELATVTHEGKDVTSGGAYINDGWMIAYLGLGEVLIPARTVRWHGRTIHEPEHAGKRGNVTTWKGDVIGRYEIIKSWRVPTPGGDWYDMHQVNITLSGGRKYQGRSQGPGMIVRAKRIAAQIREVTK